MLLDRCPVCLSVCPVLSVTVVYCGQTVGWIKMKLGVQVWPRPGHTVLDGDLPLLPKRGRSPRFSAHVCCSQMAAWINMPLGTEVGLGPGDFVIDGDPAPSRKKAQPPPNFWPMSIVATVAHVSYCWALVLQVNSRLKVSYNFYCYNSLEALFKVTGSLNKYTLNKW